MGVDDWAFRKGVNYGTILVDMETSKPIDLLPTRDSEDLKAWLRDHPGIEIITRDIVPFFGILPQKKSA